jgi:hypothetical protein
MGVRRVSFAEETALSQEAPELSDDESFILNLDKDRRPGRRAAHHHHHPGRVNHLHGHEEHAAHEDSDDLSQDVLSQAELARVALGPRDDSSAPPFTGPRPPSASGLPGAYY